MLSTIDGDNKRQVATDTDERQRRAAMMRARQARTRVESDDNSDNFVFACKTFLRTVVWGVTVVYRCYLMLFWRIVDC